ncbi:hypothetical protein MTBPR1_20275 [Candidatus Terasakiella magnetica]|uniref:Uncharacterized protein n=1 Tax=Candidatus Terasakiella magnetica TaxID=1867952 RepID=A0A1C3RGJ8_9PROT|nr:hypothetical protein [Candidatus Terasakiella magnetica]SCA56427.1 hypothetical protein MTBPR1_20275 [Candidatus Terasakiella magnetica]
MQTQINTHAATKQKDIPYSDFEVALIDNPRSKERKEISKGRFMIWGEVKSNDCPA